MNEPAAIGPYLRDPRYLAFLGVGGLIGVVRWLQLLALSVYAFELTNSPFWASVVPLLSLAPLALCGPMFGAIADRVDRKFLFALSLIAIAAASAGFAALAWSGAMSVAEVAAAAFVNGVFWATDMPIRRRLLGDLSGAALPAAMSLDAALGNATRMLGPALGGAILQFVGVAGVFLSGAVVFGICLGMVAFTRFPGRTTGAPPSSLIADLVAGARYAASDRNLRLILAVTIVFNVFGFPFTSMIPVIGRDHLGLDPFWVGFITSLEGMGAFLGALIVTVSARPNNFQLIYWSGTLIYISVVGCLALVSFTASPVAKDFFIVCSLLAIIGMAGACFAAMQSTLTYLGASPDYRSRVLGVLALCIGTGPLGFLNVGWMADMWGAPTALAIMSLEGLTALAILRWLARRG